MSAQLLRGVARADNCNKFRLSKPEGVIPTNSSVKVGVPVRNRLQGYLTREKTQPPRTLP